MIRRIIDAIPVWLWMVLGAYSWYSIGVNVETHRNNKYLLEVKQTLEDCSTIMDAISQPKTRPLGKGIVAT
jgi:hypothetical protein